MRIAALPSMCVTVFLLAGCGTESPEQTRAREERQFVKDLQTFAAYVTNIRDAIARDESPTQVFAICSSAELRRSRELVFPPEARFGDLLVFDREWAVRAARRKYPSPEARSLFMETRDFMNFWDFAWEEHRKWLHLSPEGRKGEAMGLLGLTRDPSPAEMALTERACFDLVSSAADGFLSKYEAMSARVSGDAK